MKRFFKKSYSWLATLLLTVAFAVSGNVAAQTEFTFGSNDDYQVLTFKKDGISVTGFGYNCGYAAWGDYPSLNMYVDAEAGPRTITVSVPTGTIEKIEMTTTKENGTNTNFKDVSVNTGSFSANGNTSAEWTGSSSEVVFTPSENTNVYVNKITVYATGVEAGGEDGGAEGGAEAKAVELPFAFTTSAGGTVDGVGFYMWSADWSSSTELYGQGDASATWGTVNLTCAAANIIKVELTCRTNSESGVSSNDDAAKTVCETENLEGYFSYNGNVATWVGSAHRLTFSSTDDIDVYKIVVYTLEAGEVKECTIDVDHYADNCKPGKCEYLTKYITFYMQGLASSTSWTGMDNCPEGVTLTNEVGEQFRVAQFNYWKDSDQLGIQLENEITTPGVYTLHIPEGLMPFTDGKWNKEINATWTIVEPDNRPTKDVVFDFTDGTYTNDGTLSYTKEGVVFTLNENRWNAQAQGFRIGTDGWVSFTAPEKASLKNIQLLQESSYGVSPDFTANAGEVSVYDKTLYWSGDDASVTLTDNYGSCYFTKAIVTLAVEETEEPEVDPNEECFDAWKALINGQFADIAYENGYQVPEQDVPGKKPAAVVAPCVEYWSNRTAFVQLGFDWQTVNSYLDQLYQTTIVEDYAYAQALLEAYNAAEVVPEVVVPVEKDKYTIKLNGTDYYFTTTEVKDNDVTTYSISATPEYFYIEPNGNGYTIQSADTEKWVGYDVINSWDFSNDEKVWTIGNLEGEPTYIYKNGSKGFGVDGSFEGAGVYTDKSGQYWVVEKFVEGGEVVDPVEPTDLSIFAGEWFFKGEGAYCNSPENIDGSLNPKTEYTVNISVENGEILMNGLIGDVYDYPYAYVGTYDATAGTLSFDIEEGYYGKYIIDTNWEYYIMTDALVFKVEEAEDGTITLVNDGWEFKYEDWYYSQYACGYTSCVMTREQQIVEPEPAGWNGEIILPENAATIDDLLTYTVEFDEAKAVRAANTDILGVVFAENGNPYAIALCNGTFDVFGGVSFDGGKATVEFVKIADLNAQLQESAKGAAARIGGFVATPGKASVVFCSKSFVVDGELINDMIVKEYDLNGEGAPTGIDAIENANNDTIYDLSGRRVVNANGGLYIVNGRKVYMK